jgi:hypothetical protein
VFCPIRWALGLGEKGANPSAKNKRGLTPLDIANGKGGAPGQYPDKHKNTAALLIKLGATPGQEVKEPVPAE